MEARARGGTDGCVPTLIAVGLVVCKVALAVQRKLKLLDAAAMLEDLLIPARNRLEVLKGDKRGCTAFAWTIRTE